MFNINLKLKKVLQKLEFKILFSGLFTNNLQLQIISKSSLLKMSL